MNPIFPNHHVHALGTILSMKDYFRYVCGQTLVLVAFGDLFLFVAWNKIAVLSVDYFENISLCDIDLVSNFLF